MSQENVEVVRRAFEAIAARDWDGVQRRFHADAEWHNTREFPGPGVCRGIDEIVDFWRNLFAAFADGEMHLEHVAAGEDCVVHGLRTRSEGQASGVPIDIRWAVIYRVRGDRIDRADVYGDYSRALAAARLRE